jgi:Spy/CpxP family protein refolding chaperone
MGGRGNPLCALDLTEDQQTQIAAIHRKAQEDTEAVLTPEQREKLRARRGGRGSGR